MLSSWLDGTERQSSRWGEVGDNESNDVTSSPAETATTGHAPHSQDPEEMRRSLEREIAELKEAVAARDAFIAIAAHELRNPMTPIGNQVDMLLRHSQDGSWSRERIEFNLVRLGWLVDRYLKRATTLLDVSRVNSGNLKLERQQIELSAVAREVIDSLAPVAQHARSPISLKQAEPVVGWWDRLAIEQILDNLVSNATKYGAGSPVDVAVHSHHGNAVIQVGDRGVGISEQDRARIFDRFERSVIGAQHAGGFGVGLWLVRQLVEAMHGTITVDSRPGGGSMFTVSLPLIAQENHDR